MELSDDNRHALLIAAHQAVEEEASAYADDMLHKRSKLLDYPSNGGFTPAEEEALHLLEVSPALHSALRKVLASCAAGTVSSLLNIIDGTSDPEHGNWSGVALVDKSPASDGPAEFLHDTFFATYWDWRKIRPNKNWCLDLLAE